MMGFQTLAYAIRSAQFRALLTATDYAGAWRFILTRASA